MSDYLDDEMQIMDENSRDVSVLSSRTFENKIEDMGLKMPLSVAPTATLAEVLTLMQTKNIGCVLVCDKKKVVGIFTERDVLFRVLGKLLKWESVPVSHVMTPDPLCLRKSDMVAYVMNNMHVRNFRHIPIVNDKHEAVGVISIKDIMSYILDHCPEHVMNLTGEPFRGVSGADGG
jgi:CBS domain-containing protein